MATPVPNNQEADLDIDRDVCDHDVDSTCCDGCICGENCNCSDGCNCWNKCNGGQTNGP